jgi:hypothetical protein
MSETRYLHYGDNGSQEFWATLKGEGRQLDLCRNHKEVGWFAIYDGCVVEDADELRRRQRTNPALVGVVLTRRSAAALAKIVQRRLDIQLAFDDRQLHPSRINKATSIAKPGARSK